MNKHMISRKPENLDWSLIPTISMTQQDWTPAVDIVPTAQICYDEEALYLRLSAKEAHIRAEYSGLLDSPCQDSCLEFFFCPCERDNRYFNIEFNPNCCVYLGFGTSVLDLIRLIPEEKDILLPEAVRTDDGWYITYRVPYYFIRRFFPDFKAAPGKTMRANFYKCGDLTVKEHYFAWNPIVGEEMSFHRTCDFGLLEFE